MSKKITQTAGRAQLGEFAPMFAHLNDDVLFGEVWNEEAIDVKTKCIITVVSLMASGITDSSLGYHLQNAKNNGVTKEEIAAIITHATMYVGWPKGWAVFRLAKEVWNEEEPALTENDKYQLVKECRYKGVEKKQSVLCDKHWRDIQRLYTRVFRKSRKPSLEYALTEVSVGIEGRMHCARDDARNTAYLLQTMAIKEKYLKAKEHIDKYVDTPKHSATIGEIIGVDLSALYALCEETQ